MTNIQRLKLVSNVNFLLASSVTSSSPMTEIYDFSNLLNAENLTKSKVRVKDRLSAMSRSTYGPQKLHRKR